MKPTPFTITLLFGLIMLAAVACNSETSPVQTPSLTAEGVVATYKTFTLVTPTALVVPDIGLCRLPVAGIDTFLHVPYNQPMRIYVNEVAQAAMAEAGERVFPAGSIIVKEKLDHMLVGITISGTVSVDQATLASASITGLGIMIKHEKGFNPVGGDWEYAYWENGQLYQDAGKLAHCQSCHTAGTIPANWQEKYGPLGIQLKQVARDSIFLTLPGNP